MFYWLRDQSEVVPEMVNPVLQAAFRCALMSDPDVWSQIKDCRNQTSHTYNEAKAVEVAGFVRAPALEPFGALQARLQTA